MLDIIRKLRHLLDRRERRNAVLLFFLILATGIMEAVGVASIMPFLSVLSNPEVVQENPYLSYVYNGLGFSSPQSFLLFTGVVVFVVVVSGLGLKAFTQYALARFTQMRNYSISTRLLRAYLARPYSWFLNRHSSDLGKTVLSEVQQVITNALLPTAQFIANAVIALCLIAMLVMVDVWVALFAAALLGGSYGLVYVVLRKYLSRIGADRVKANRERFQIAQEALGGIKEVKAAGLEAGYLSSFGRPAHRFARRQAANMIIGQLPQFILQAVAFGGILAIVLILMAARGGDLGQILPTLGVFAFAGQRLLPALQQVYQNATKMRFGKPALDSLYADLEGASNEALQSNRNIEPLPLKKSLELKNIGFTYPDAKQPAIQDIDLHIPACTTVGLAGSTGAGKTTLVDIIMGLLPPDHGQLLVDNKPIFSDKSHFSGDGERITDNRSQSPDNKSQLTDNRSLITACPVKQHEVLPGEDRGFTGDNLSSSADNRQRITDNTLRRWQRALGYVPQQIFLADDTVAANIAFGVPAEEIDLQAVERAASIAELHDFVLQELPHGYQTTVGERGVRLSGGQRQRIGIARALYHDPDVLILDEATSALDNLTEKAVMDAVHNLARQKTIVMIAHRLSTVQKCDCIFLLEYGRLIGQGTYDQLLDKSHEFRRMAAVNE